jgi:hypothetical protein
VNGQEFKVAYIPGDSDSGMFGGNSNWRGPIWIAVNFLLVESLLRFYMFYGTSFQVECPTGSGEYMHLGHVAEEIQHRLQHLMARDNEGRRAINSGNNKLDFDEHWKDYLHFYEFFDGDTGRGLGASHQCGWTGLMAKMIHDTGVNCRLPMTPRTPGTAAAHYFDDILSRNPKGSLARRKSSLGPGTPGPGRMRRSSTSRSIGNRASFATNGDDTHPDSPKHKRKGSAASSYFGQNAGAESVISDEWGEEGALSLRRQKSEAELSEADEKIDDYVRNELTKIKTGEGEVGVYEDEFEAQLD